MFMLVRQHCANRHRYLANRFPRYPAHFCGGVLASDRLSEGDSLRPVFATGPNRFEPIRDERKVHKY